MLQPLSGIRAISPGVTPCEWPPCFPPSLAHSVLGHSSPFPPTLEPQHDCHFLMPQPFAYLYLCVLFCILVLIHLTSVVTPRQCGEECGKEQGKVPPGCFLHGSDLHPNHHTDCVLESECFGVPRHAVCPQNLCHPVPPGTERAEAEAEP